MSDIHFKKEASCDGANTNSNTVNTSQSAAPKNVPARLWEKFKALEKRTDEATKRSTDKRIKHLQKAALENVARSLSNQEDREIVQLPSIPDEKSCSTASPTCGSRKRRLETDTVSNAKDQDKKQHQAEAEGVRAEEKEWKEVRGLMGVNDHLAGVSHGPLGPRTVLETRIEEAIADGDLEAAEKLSDHMANREFGEKVASAIDAKNFLQHKQEEGEMAKAKRKKKLQWGFEAKNRWETKSNM